MKGMTLPASWDGSEASFLAPAALKTEPAFLQVGFDKSPERAPRTFH